MFLFFPQYFCIGYASGKQPANACAFTYVPPFHHSKSNFKSFKYLNTHSVSYSLIKKYQKFFAKASKFVRTLVPKRGTLVPTWGLRKMQAVFRRFWHQNQT
jgi:hypothetical protein